MPLRAGTFRYPRLQLIIEHTPSRGCHHHTSSESMAYLSWQAQEFGHTLSRIWLGLDHGVLKSRVLSWELRALLPLLIEFRSNYQHAPTDWSIAGASKQASKHPAQRLLAEWLGNHCASAEGDKVPHSTAASPIRESVEASLLDTQQKKGKIPVTLPSGRKKWSYRRSTVITSGSTAAHPGQRAKPYCSKPSSFPDIDVPWPTGKESTSRNGEGIFLRDRIVGSRKFVPFTLTMTLYRLIMLKSGELSLVKPLGASWVLRRVGRPGRGPTEYSAMHSSLDPPLRGALAHREKGSLRKRYKQETFFARLDENAGSSFDLPRSPDLRSSISLGYKRSYQGRPADIYRLYPTLADPRPHSVHDVLHPRNTSFTRHGIDNRHGQD
eukprot:Gb_19461 [translate_table: standard]